MIDERVHLRIARTRAEEPAICRRMTGTAPSPAACSPEHARRLAAGLVGRTIPALRLKTWKGTAVELSGASNIVVYLYPAAASSPDGGSDSSADDAAQHRAFDRHRADLYARSLSTFGLSSEPPRAQLVRTAEHRICHHELISDAELQLAHALGLPTFTHDGAERYRRLTIVAFAGRIVKAFFPIESPQRSATQVICWLKATGQ